MSVHVFVGPTIPATDVLSILPDAVVHPPVSYGDLLRVAPRAGDTVVIIDGHYHQTAAVRHKEILNVIASGVHVIGCASMGAQRAAELCDLHMRGIGEVFSLYHSGAIHSDDEVAVAHGEPPEYRSFIDALVNIRHVLACAVQAGAVTDEIANELVTHACDIAYTQRSWRSLQLRVASSPRAAAGLRAALDYAATQPQVHDVKRSDARLALETVAAGGGLSPQAPDWTTRRGWRTSYLRHWIDKFSGAVIEDEHVELASVARFIQLYDPGFSRRWHAYALGVVANAGRREPGAADAVAALRQAAALGVSLQHLDPAQVDFWVDPAERAGLSPEEVLTRLLVRSLRPTAGLADLSETAPLLYGELRWAQQAVAEAYTVNREFAVLDPRYELLNLRWEILSDHVRKVWGIRGADKTSLTAAARDRAFPDVEAAAEASRPFFLRHELLRGDDAGCVPSAASVPAG